MNEAASDRPAKTRGFRYRRALWLTLLAIGFLAVVIAVAVPLALRSSTVRGALLERAGRAVEAASGMRFTADDVSLGGFLTTVELRGVELAAAGAERPFLTVPRVRAVLRPLSFLTRRWEIRSLEVDAPALDLGAPLPELTGEEPAEPGREMVLASLALHRGTVTAPAEALAPDSWLESWTIEGIELRGAYRTEETRLELETATLTARRRGGDAFEATLAGRLRGPAAGPYGIESLTARGDGLELDASGRVGGGPDGPLEVAFRLAADPARLVPERLTGGRIEGEGDLDLRRGSGRAHLEARGFPAELVEPWIGRGTMERMGAAGSRLDLVADLDLDPAAAGEAGGRADLAWRRGDETLLEATAEGRGLRLVDGALDFGALAAELEVNGVGLRAEMLEPWLGREALAGARAAGTRLDLDAEAVVVAGRPGDARGQARVVWRRGAATLVRAAATTTGGGLRADGSLDLDSLRGRLDLAGRDLPAELANPWIDEAELERFAAAGTVFDLEADLTLRSLRPRRVDGRARMVWRNGDETLLTAAATLPEAGRGPRGVRLAVEGELLPASPGRRHLRAELEAADWDRVADARIAGTRIAGGRLELEIPDLEAAAGELRRRWPLLVPEAPAEWPLAGGLEAAADLAGTLGSPELGGEAVWRRVDGSLLTLTAAGAPLARRGEAKLRVEALDLAGLRDLLGPETPELAGRVAGSIDLAGSPEAWTGELRLAGDDLRWGSELPTVDRLELEAASDGASLRLTRILARAGERVVTGDGEVALARPIAEAGLRLELARPAAGVDRMLVDARLADGVLQLAVPEIDTAGGRGTLTAAIPLAALRALPPVWETLATWPLVTADGAVTLRFSLPELDAAALLASLEVAGGPEVLTLAAGGDLELDLADPTASRGSLRISELAAADGEHRLEAAAPLVLALAGHRLAGEALRLVVDGRQIEATGGLDLRPGWRPQDPLADLVASVDAVARGAVEAALLNPWLGGAAASGPLDLELQLRGPPDRLGGRLKIAGPEARLVALKPYFTRLESPEIELEIDAGEVFLNRARARLNQGSVELTGYREPGGEIELFAELEDVRYRLDYGLSTVLSGSLQLSLPAAADGVGELSGRLIVDRGLLRRDLNLEREVLGSLLAPAELAVADPDDPLTRIELDLQLATADGVRVKNNLADLRVTWSPLVVRGTLAAPRVDGRLDVDPGGFAYLYGQTARVDEAALTLIGYPDLPPRIDLEVTTSLDDPAVAREGAGRVPVAAAPPRDADQIETDRQALATAGLASYYADRLAGRFGQALGGTRIEVAPLLVFGETDPGARLTVSRDLSTHVAVAVSTDLTEEGRQIYLLDLHDFRRLPRLSGQLFTTDDRNEGVTLQQTFELGGRRDASGPRIHAIRLEAPEGFGRRRLAAATGLSRGDRLPEGADFDAEVDVAEHLRREGYPGAEVAVRTEAGGGDRVDLVVAVAPGPRVAFEFRGEALPRPARRTIRGLYRADFYEPAALEEMRRETVRALRGLGHLAPRAEITVEAGGAPEAEGGTPAAERTVIVDARGGPRQAIAGVDFGGVPADVGERLAAAFAVQADRVELLATDPEADRRLLALLRGLGYPQPRVAARRLADGRRLVVDLEPGPRRRIAEVLFEGIPAEEAAKLRPLLTLAPGDAARADRIAGGAAAIENDLRHRGYAEARVRPLAVPRADGPEGGSEVVLTYRVAAGPRYELAAVRFDGVRATGPRWAERVADLEKGDPVDPEKIGEARRRLFATGVFRSVVPDVEHDPELGRATVVFEVEERPRFQVAYGLRWETHEGAGAVVDAVDRNAFGRGVTLGLRAFYSADDESVRLYSAFPKIFGTGATLELFAEGRQFREEDEFGVLLTRRIEGTVQVSHPLGRRTTTRVYYRFRLNHLFEEEPDPFFPFDIRVSNPVLGWQLLRDSRDDKIDPGRGLLGSLDLSGGDDFLGSDFSFVRLLAKVSLFRSAGRLGGRRLTWAQSWRLGLAEPFGDRLLDPDDRFEAGGEYSVRGYPNDSISPLDELIGRPLGGNALLVVNQELRFPLWRDLRGLLFFDAGNVWADAGDVDLDLLKSLGLGLRASTPVGLVRLDVAFPLDRRPGDDGYSLYLGLGNVF